MTLVAKTSAYSLAAGPGEVWGSPTPLWKTLPGPFIQVSEVTSRHNPSGQVDKQPRDRTLTPLQWKRRVSTTGPLRKSSEGFNYEHVAETPHTGSLAEEPVSTCVLFSSWSRHHLPGQPPLGIPCLGFIRHGRKRARVGRRGMEAGFQLKSKQSGSVTLTR